VKKISLSLMLSLFALFINGYAEENTPKSELSLALSRHSPYISYDISREEAGIGYRYQRNIFMYDFHGTYKFLNLSWTHGHLTSLSFHFLSIAKETPSFLFYTGVGVRGEFYSLKNSSYRRKDRFCWSPSFCWGYSFKRKEGPSPFAEIYYIPTRFYRGTHDQINKIGLKVGVLY